MGWLTILTSVISLIPAIIKAVEAIESVIPEPKKGADKLQIIKTTFDAVGGESAVLWPYIKEVISGIVKIFNATGLFKKS